MSQNPKLVKITSFFSGESSNEISELNTTRNESTDPSDELSANTSSILITSSVVTSNEETDYLLPNQPSGISSIQPKRTKTQNVYFQKSWFEKYPWIHYEPSLKLIVCVTCSKAARLKLLENVPAIELAFVSEGFKN